MIDKYPCGHVSWPQSFTGEAQGRAKDIVEVHEMVKRAKEHSTLGLKYIRVPIGQMLVLAFSDANWGTRADGTSQGGFITMRCHKDVFLKYSSNLSILNFGSNKLRIICRSSLATETQAFSIAFDDLDMTRLLVAELASAHEVD